MWKKQVIKPNEDFVLVIVDDSEAESPNALIVPKEPSDTFLGTVDSMGPGRILESGKHIKPKFTVGDRVIIPTGVGRALVHNGKFCVFVHTTEILGTLENTGSDPYNGEVVHDSGQ